MRQATKLNLSSAEPMGDRWRAVSDFSGGALTLAVWVALWTWIAVGVVGPLAGAVQATHAAASSLL